MAFLRLEKKKSGSYIRLVETIRVDGKVTSRTIASLGKKEDYSPEQLRRMGEKLYAWGGGEIKNLLGEGLEEIGRFNYGYYQLVRKALTHYRLDHLFERLGKKKRLSFDLLNAIMLMVVERLHDPASKRSNYHNQEEYMGITPVELQHLYRSLDHLADYSELVQNHIFQTGRNLFNQSLDVVFYDITTFYFDSDKKDELRAKGFSKDGKQGKVQILFGLLIDKHKQPIGYRIYKGDFYEGHTFTDALDTLKSTYQLDNIIVVADRGMLNKTNIDLTENKNQYGFIMGERLKSLPKPIKEHLLNKDNYSHQWCYNKEEDQIKILYTRIEYQGRTIIGTWSEKRAKKDKADREEQLEKAEKLLANPSGINRKARRFFLKNEKDETFVLDKDKIAEAERYDGFMAISTNQKELNTETVLDHYRHLFQIEQTFRTFKHHLETRPMFHWTEKRIEGHICMCYITYTVLNFLLQRLHQKGVKISETQLRKNVDKMQVSLLSNGKDEFYLRSNNTHQLPAIISRLGLPAIPNITAEKQIKKYL